MFGIKEGCGKCDKLCRTKCCLYEKAGDCDRCSWKYGCEPRKTDCEFLESVKEITFGMALVELNSEIIRTEAIKIAETIKKKDDV